MNGHDLPATLGRPRVWRIVGGPRHGQVIADGEIGLHGSGPVMLLGEPRDEAFLDEIVGELLWNPSVEWYERRLVVEHERPWP